MGSFDPGRWNASYRSSWATSRPAIELSMIVTITSLAPVAALRYPAMKPYRPPAATDAARQASRCTGAGRS